MQVVTENVRVHCVILNQWRDKIWHRCTHTKIAMLVQAFA